MQSQSACQSCLQRNTRTNLLPGHTICLQWPSQRPCISSSRGFKQQDRVLVSTAAVRKRLGSIPFASTALAETTWATSRRTVQQKELQRPRKLHQAHLQQQQLLHSSSRGQPPVNNTINNNSSNSQLQFSTSTTRQGAASYSMLNNMSEPEFKSQRDSHSSSSSQTSPNEVLSSAIDKIYKQRLREVKSMVQSGTLDELRQGLTPEQQQSLQLVLQDLQDLQGSWEEDDEQLNPAEQQLVDQLASTQLMPDDFNSYLLAMLPEGCGPDELQQLMYSLDPAVLQDLQSVYYDLKDFEQSQLDVAEAQQRYMELSSRIATVTARVQGTLAAQQQQQQQQQLTEQQQQPRQPLSYSRMAYGGSSSNNQEQQQQQQRAFWERQPEQPLRYSSFAYGSSSSSSSSSSAGRQQQQQARHEVQAPQTTPSSSSSTVNSSSSSSTAGRKGWGSSWAKPRGNRTKPQPATVAGGQEQQQHEEQGGSVFGQQQQPVVQEQPQQNAASPASEERHNQLQEQQQQQSSQQFRQQQPADVAAQQQQQPGGGTSRPRRRRSIIRRESLGQQQEQQ